MSNPHQPLDGPNGHYSVCCECGKRYGTPPDGAIVMWHGTCAICNKQAVLSNALHDWNITDERCREVMNR